MKRWTKMISAVLAVMLLGSLLAGCGKKELDAAKAVDAYLRAETKGEFDDYAEIVGEDKEKLEEEYNKMIDEMMQMFDEIEMLGITFSDDFGKEVKNLLASAKYKVIGAKKEGEGYVVDVDVYPSDVFSLFFSNVMDTVKTAGTEDEVGPLILKALQSAIEKQTYGDAESYKVHIDYNKDDKKYEINQKDVTELASHFFVVEDAINQIFTPSGKDYKNKYLNWTAEDWNAASEKEKTKCCHALIQEIQGLSDEEMKAIQLDDASIAQIKEAINVSFSGGLNISIGDYTEMLKQQMGME